MGKPTSSFSIPGFIRLGPSVYLQEPHLNSGTNIYHTNQTPTFPSVPLHQHPPSPTSTYHARTNSSSTHSSEVTSPDVIILTSWTGASAKHVAKYTNEYNALYPGVPILLITTVVADFFLHSTAHKLAALKPAVDYLLLWRSGYDAEAAEEAEDPLQYFYPTYAPTWSTSASAMSSASSVLSRPYSSRSVSTTATAAIPSFTTATERQRNPRQGHRQPPSVLLHAFSEGGAHKAVLLARAYRAAATAAAQSKGENGDGSGVPKIPVRALLLDSTPGTPSFARMTTAFARAMPGYSPGGSSGKRTGSGVGDGTSGGTNEVQEKDVRSGKANLLARGLAHGVVGVVWIGLHVRGQYGENDIVSETRRALNDGELWDFSGEQWNMDGTDNGGLVRTYLFGEEDDVVWWRDVHEHGVESAKQGNTAGGGGLGSLMVRFKRTEHCAHARVNGEVYWGAVRRTWEMRADGGMGLRMGLGRRLSLDSLCFDDEGSQ
ncbi:hypothetical protein B0J18DRAFT_292489 [Chaetomium sp. MPI-SDFR-AT-0129]|nr:hypothetical protein B0J18DRAFT_292489 [Chaetomium sp. MPI-SDFR-AT-0129]